MGSEQPAPDARPPSISDWERRCTNWDGVPGSLYDAEGVDLGLVRGALARTALERSRSADWYANFRAVKGALGMESQTDLTAILRVLTEHAVDFVVVGAFSALLQGVPRPTEDVDILHKQSPDSVAKLLAALAALDAKFWGDARNLRPNESHLLAPGSHQLLQTRFGRLDVLGVVEDATTYDDVQQHLIECELGGFTVRALELGRLILVKERAGRPKDLAVLPEYRATLAELKKSGR